MPRDSYSGVEEEMEIEGVGELGMLPVLMIDFQGDNIVVEDGVLND